MQSHEVLAEHAQVIATLERSITLSLAYCEILTDVTCHGWLHTISVVLAAGNQSQSRISTRNIGAGGLSPCPFFPRSPPAYLSCQPKVSPPPPLSPPKDLPKAVIISLVVQTHFLCSCPQSYVCDIMHLADTDIICIVLACSVLSLLPSAVERLGFEQYMLTT